MWNVPLGHLLSVWKEYLSQKSRYRLVGSPWLLCSFFKLQEGKNSYFYSYFCFEGRFQAIFAKIHQKMDCKARKAFKDTLGVPLKCSYYRYDTPYSHRKHKIEIKNFSKNLSLTAKSFTKIQSRLWWKTSQKWWKKSEIVPEVSKNDSLPPNYI